ncbi:MAG: M15 family metallopeptidase [Campylobacterales bacterium]|nr:M15 family metallopeptidase [Campylobacterales bacterium]
MPKFSKKSKEKLLTCTEDIQKVMNEAIKRIDFKVLYGHRTPEEQLKLFKKGRKYYNGKWVKVGKTVTDKDGTIRKSKHNFFPSQAIDIIPHPFTTWDDLEQFHKLHKVIMEVAKELNINLVWGADWDSDGNIQEHSLQDYPHYQV